LLYRTSARLNELRDLVLSEIEEFPKTKRIFISESKTGNSRTCTRGPRGLKLLEEIEGDVEFLKAKGFVLLGASFNERSKAMSNISWIRGFNKILDRITSEEYLPNYFTSHSLRIGFVTRLLKNTDIFVTSQLVGHASVSSTQMYSRNLLS
jgi:integrase